MLYLVKSCCYRECGDGSEINTWLAVLGQREEELIYSVPLQYIAPKVLDGRMEEAQYCISIRASVMQYFKCGL